MSNIWKTSTNNKWITKGLFYELTQGDRPYAVFTLKDTDLEKDGVTYYSLRKLYVESEDPTDYEFATQWLGGWEHWQVLKESAELKDHVEAWQEERDVRLRSKGVKKLIELAKSSDASFQAAKWLADRGWEDKKKRGRPSKAEVKAATKRAAGIATKTGSDLERIRSVS